MKKYQIDSVVYGGGGGFVGLSETFSLKANGNWYKYASKFGSKASPKKIDEPKVRIIFQTIKESGMELKSFNEPGNITYFITIYSKKMGNTSWKWGSTSYKVNSKIENIYLELQELQN